MPSSEDIGAVHVLSEIVSDLSAVVRETAVTDSAFKERMTTCAENAVKTHKAMFLDNGESVISKVKEFEKRLARLEKSAAENRRSDKDIKIAWITVIRTITGSVMAIIGAYLAYVNFWS